MANISNRAHLHKEIVQIFTKLLQSKHTLSAFNYAVIELIKIDFQNQNRLKAFAIKQLRNIAKLSTTQKKITHI